MSLYGIGETYHHGFSTYNASDALAAADATPTGVLVVNGADTAATVTISSPAAGDYKIAADLAGRAVGDDCYVRYSATVGGVTQHGRTPPFRVAFSAALASPVATGSIPTAAQIDAQLSGSHGSGAWGGNSGALPGGVVVAGSTASAVTLSGLAAGKNFAGQRLLDTAAGEYRQIASQTFANGNYTLTLGSGTGELGPFSDAPTTNATLYLCP